MQTTEQNTGFVNIVCYQNNQKVGVIKVSKKAIMLSKTIANMIQDVPSSNPDEEEIPIQNISPETMQKVKDFCVFYTGQHTEDEKKVWHENFFHHAPKQVIFECVSAANFLDISSLLDLCCEEIANRIRNKSVQEMREFFGVVNDFTPEEEEQIRKENEWLSSE